MPLTFIHAGDLHLGKRPPHDTRRLIAAQYLALEIILRKAVAEAAAFVLLCGDTFDRSRPGQIIIDKFSAITGQYPSIPIFIIPGTHDYLGMKSVFLPENAASFSENVIILNDPGASPRYLKANDAYLYFRPNRSNKSTSSPIEGMRRCRESGFHIGLAHGSLADYAPGVAYDYPINCDEVINSGLDYLALGHWHKPRDMEMGKTRLAYCGIPQPLTFSDPETGSANLVEISDSHEISITPFITATVAMVEVSAKIFHPQQVMEVWEKLTGRQAVVKLNVIYSDTLREVQEADEIINNPPPGVFLVKKNSGKKTIEKHIPNNAADGERITLLEAYAEELKRLAEADSSERGPLYERALELGQSIIKGGVNG